MAESKSARQVVLTLQDQSVYEPFASMCGTLCPCMPRLLSLSNDQSDAHVQHCTCVGHVSVREYVCGNVKLCTLQLHLGGSLGPRQGLPVRET